MAESSDSDSSSIKGWTFVGPSAEVENGSDTSSSEDFINLESDFASYHIKDKSPSPSEEATSLLSQNNTEPGTTQQLERHDSVNTESDDDIGPVDSDDQSVEGACGGPRPELADLPLRISVDLSKQEGISPSEGEHLELFDECTTSGASPIKVVDELDTTLCSSLGSSPDIEVLTPPDAREEDHPDVFAAVDTSVVTSSMSGSMPNEAVKDVDCSSMPSVGSSPDFEVLEPLASEPVKSQKQESTKEKVFHISEALFAEAKPVEEVLFPAESVSQPEASGQSHDQQEGEEVEQPHPQPVVDVEVPEPVQDVPVLPVHVPIHVPVHVYLPPVVQPAAQADSDSDSDYVRLDGALSMEDLDAMIPESDRDVMHGSSSSSRGSSVSAHFHFINPGPYGFYTEDGDLDDRCESDISGIAADESDLSNMTYSIGELQLSAGIRAYRHRPNQTLNSMLTFFTILAIIMTIGVGIGHYMGTNREMTLRRLQIQKMKDVQDEYLMCLQRQDNLERLTRTVRSDKEHFEVVSDVWRDRYDELVQEKQLLDAQLKQMENIHQENVLQIQRQIKEGQKMQAELESLSISIEEEEEEEEEEAEYDIDVTVVTLPDPPQAEAAVDQSENKPAIAMDKARGQPTVGITVSVTSDAENAQVKDKINQLEVENADLRSQIGKLRYGEHPANQKEAPPSHVGSGVEIRIVLNELQQENADLKAEVSKLRYSKMDGANSNTPVEPQVTEPEIIQEVRKEEQDIDTMRMKLRETNHLLEVEKGRSQLWQSMFVAERTRFQSSEDQKDEALKNNPGFFTCLSLLLPRLNMTAPWLKDSFNITAHWQFLHNVTADLDMSEALASKWIQLQKLVQEQELTDQARILLDDILISMSDKWQAFQQYTESRQFQDQYETAKDSIHQFTQTVKNMTQTNRFADYVNKTKATVSKISGVVHDTWKKVKYLSSKLQEKPLVRKLTEKLSSIGENIQGKWNKVQDKFARKNWFRKRNNKHDKKKYEDKPKKKKYKEDSRDQDSFQGSNGKFEGKPNHKQTESNHEYEKYDEFWKQAEFDPDDLEQDGFFEGNQREWQKHQKRLHKLHGRIHKLNEDTLHSMDDDDMEDLYDDIDDFQDDVEDEDVPKQLKTWLSCQLIWWKSRFHRKHRDQDLMKGCGNQLMQWQLRVLCKPRPCKKGKKKCDRENGKPFSLHPLCPQILHQSGFQHNQGQCHGNCCHGKQTQGFHSDTDQKNSYKNQEDACPQTDKETVISDFSHDSTNKEAAQDSSWLFARAQDREDLKLTPDWEFDRAAERDFERTKPWYYERAHLREEDRYKKKKIDENLYHYVPYPDQE